uniref:Uncharacterized protein n=1 Tax=Globodera rostochiensis TaxID=31243 RepID=A0A914I0Y6_GLORO
MFRYGIPPFPLPSNDVGLHLLDVGIDLPGTARILLLLHKQILRLFPSCRKRRILPFLSKSRKAGGGFVFGNLILFTEQNNNNNIHAVVRRRCQPTETVQSKSAVSATIPPKMEEIFPTEIGTSSEGKRRRFCRMNNMREEQQMGRNHSEEGILMGLGMMEEERGEGVPMPPRENGLWGWDEEDGRGAAGSGGKSWRSTGIGTHCQQCQWEDEMRGRAIDRYSRALFPTIFFSFCLAYWLYYWVLMNHE